MSYKRSDKEKEDQKFNKTGAWLIVYALEQLGITHTFGIPGVHNTEIYDELSRSNKIEPVLVTHEMGAAFMADGISRTSNQVGTLVVVPAAGVTHAMSGIGEAYLAGIPMLVISGGVRRDNNRSFQLHQMDQQKLMSAITKKTYLVRKHRDIVQTVFEAYGVASGDEPGPVHVEIPADIQLFRGEVDVLPTYRSQKVVIIPEKTVIEDAVDIITSAKRPGIFAGWGARDSMGLLIELAERLNAPVSTTLQGLSVFPGDHPLHVGMGFSKAGLPAAEKAFQDRDCLIAIGTRFSEIPTGSFSIKVPSKLIHIDINPDVFNKNYSSLCSIHGDSSESIRGILQSLEERNFSTSRDGAKLKNAIRENKEKYHKEWANHKAKGVNAYSFFTQVRTQLKRDAIAVVDDGNHTYLAAELFPSYQSKHFICPTDFNSMGYAVPAAIGVKIVNPEKQVVGFVGDGAFLMTCMEILTASTLSLGVIYFVFSDGELSQVSQGQEIPYNRKTCTILGDYDLEGIAKAVRAQYLIIEADDQIEEVVKKALSLSETKGPVIVNLKIDNSKRTRFTKGVVQSVLKRFPLKEKVRFVKRAFVRKVTG